MYHVSHDTDMLCENPGVVIVSQGSDPCDVSAPDLDNGWSADSSPGRGGTSQEGAGKSQEGLEIAGKSPSKITVPLTFSIFRITVPLSPFSALSP